MRLIGPGVVARPLHHVERVAGPCGRAKSASRWTPRDADEWERGDIVDGRSIEQVLIIEGDENARRELSRALREAFVITRSPTVKDAIGLLRAGHRYEMIVCAIAEGRELEAFVLAELPFMASRVVFLVDRASANDVGPCAYIERTGSLDDLRRRLVRALSSIAA